MELKQLEYFLTVSKLKSFTAAAEQLYVSQPGVTTAIKRLEEELGIQLFIRNKKNAILTAEGRVFFNHIEIIMRDVSKAITTVTELKNLSSGTIRIGLSPITGVSVLTFLLVKFRTLYPSLQLTFSEGGSASLRKELAEDKLDVAFINYAPDSTDEMLRLLPLGQQEFKVALPAYHMLKDKASLPLRALAHENFITFQEDCLARKILLEQFSAAGLAPTIRFASNSLQTIKRLILCGAGISILPGEALENDLNCRAVALDPPLFLPFGLAHKKNKHFSHAAETFCNFIKDSLAE